MNDRGDMMRDWFTDSKQDALLAVGAALLVFTAFGLGRASAPPLTKQPLSVEEFPVLQASLTAYTDVEDGFVASKNGTRYYPPGCSGASRINEENMVWFMSEQEALEAGYTPAKTCSF